MAIDPSTIVWDDAAPAQPAVGSMPTGQIDPATIVWDDEGEGGQPPLEIDIVGGTRATDTMSGVDRFRAGLGKSLVDTGYGIAQALTPPKVPDFINRAADSVDQAIGSPTYSAIRRGVMDAYTAPGEALEAAAAERRATDQDLMDTGAGMSGNVVGTIAQLLGPGFLARGTAAAPALLPTTIRGNALNGLIMGSLQPSTSSSDRAQNALVGGVLGGTGAGVVRGASAGAGAARNLLSRTGMTATDRQAAQVLAREATNPNQLVIQGSAVPGVERTLGEASGDSGLMALENVMRARDRGAFEPIDLRNNAARVSQLQRIAGSDSDMAAAEAARDSVVDTRLAQSLQEGGQYEQGLRAAQQAERQSAISAAGAATAENQRLASMGLGGRVPVPEVPAEGATVSEGLRNLRGMVTEMQGQNAARPSVQSAINDVSRALRGADESVGSLYQVRQYIGDLLAGKAGADKSYARSASRELIQIRDALDAELANRAPSFPEYLGAYRAASKPINRMEVGREILNRSSSTAQDQLGNPILTPSGVSRATNDLDAIAAKATDFKKARADQILTADDLASLRAIQDDMQRIAQRNRSAAAGSQTMERLSVGERAAMRGAASKLPWVGPLFEHFEGAANQRLNERLAFLMANPKEAQRVMAALPKQDASNLRKTLGQLALASGRSAQPASD
ncbi:hypothetical protein [Stenotrophomonas sp. BIGb0135]|uniref:hypothetical protein n=1 Tax=Stenotrophomonas sp. BIGb0135 TaxID=2940620 RepID=UPI002169C40C|nr:hypothetical protein [Stenotrophomonas sp. BIGb0135]MCS4234407.1 hypothetical protein [Stenotrophomonas sp. BIGb0135]